MTERRPLKEKTVIVEKELSTITESLERLSAALKSAEELKTELKGLKLFLGRMHPEFKSQYPEIIKKIRGQKTC